MKLKDKLSLDLHQIFIILDIRRYVVIVIVFVHVFLEVRGMNYRWLRKIID